MGNSPCFRGLAAAREVQRKEFVGSRVFFHNGISWSLGVVDSVDSVDHVRVKRLGTESTKLAKVRSESVYFVENGVDEYFCLSRDEENVEKPHYESLQDSFGAKQVPYVQSQNLGVLFRGLSCYAMEDSRACRIIALWSADAIDVEFGDGSLATIPSSALSRTPVPASEMKSRIDSDSTAVRSDSRRSISSVRSSTLKSDSSANAKSENDLYGEMFEHSSSIANFSDKQAAVTQKSGTGKRLSWMLQNAGLQNARSFDEENNDELLTGAIPRMSSP